MADSIDRKRPRQIENRLSTELRDAEREVDEAHRSNALMGHDFGVAAWHYLASAEEQHLRAFVQEAMGRGQRGVAMRCPDPMTITNRPPRVASKASLVVQPQSFANHVCDISTDVLCRVQMDGVS